MSTTRTATILWIAALLCAIGAWADDRPADLEHAPHLISTALRKMAKGIQKVLKHGASHGNTTATPLFQFHSGELHAAKNLQEIETGISDVAMSIEDWVANVSRKDKARKQSEAHDTELAKQEVLKLQRATARVRNASHARSVPKAAEIARLQAVKDQLNAEIRKRMPPPPTVSPKQPLASGNIHALAKYLWAPRRDENPTPKPTAPDPPVAMQNSSQVPTEFDAGVKQAQQAKKSHLLAPVTAKELADEVMRKQKEAAKEQIRKEEEIAAAAQNASLAALRNKKVKMSRKLRGYLHMPTSPPPVSHAVEKRKELHVSPGRKHLIAAADILARMSESANSSKLAAPMKATSAAKPAASLAPLAPKKAATSALQLSKFWAIPKDSQNVWPWVKGGVHM